MANGGRMRGGYVRVQLDVLRVVIVMAMILILGACQSLGGKPNPEVLAIKTTGDLSAFLLGRSYEGYWKSAANSGPTRIEFIERESDTDLRAKLFDTNQYRLISEKVISVRINVDGLDRTLQFESAGSWRLSLTDVDELYGVQQFTQGGLNRVYLYPSKK